VNRYVAFVILSAVVGILVPANAAAVGAQEQGPPPRLRSASLSVDVAAPDSAAVRAAFEFASTGEIVLLVTQIPGQRIEALSFEADGAEVTPEREQRSSAIVAYRLTGVADRRAVTVAYDIRNAPEAEYRFALPVPEATPSGQERAVRLDVRLPPDAAFAGNAFPVLVATDDGWSNETVAVPALLHVVFGEAGSSLFAHRLLELTAIVMALALIGGGWLVHRRRAAA
jgi:hypothetical protein